MFKSSKSLVDFNLSSFISVAMICASTPACAPEPSQLGAGATAIQRDTLVLGQPDFTTVERLKQGFQDPIGMCSDGTRLAVVERTNNRVLIWNQFPSSSAQPADVVLGQPNLSANLINHTPGAPGTVSARSLYFPTGCHFSATGIIVADRSNHRVLIWNQVPTVNQTAADVVLCQPDMVSGTANNGGVTAQSCYQPYSMTVSGTKLILSDINNSRVLIWNTLPTTNRVAADVVLGQPNMTSNTSNNGGVTSQSMSIQGRMLSTSGGRLFFADAFNNRVLIWNTIPTSNFAAADIVLGQPIMTAAVVNNTPGSAGTVSAQSMSAPRGVWSDGTRLFVAEYGNNRVLIWNTIPTSNQLPADVVLGQPDLTSGLANNTPGAAGTVSALSLSGLHCLYGVGSKLIVGDYSNQRILIWNSIPTTHQAAPDLILGQPTASSSAIGGALSAKTVDSPVSLSGDGTRLYAADSTHNRILVWNSRPLDHQVPADFSLGQPSLASNVVNAGGVSAQSLSGVSSVSQDGTRLFAADTANHRVLIWNSFPTSQQAASTFVLGQPNMTGILANNGGISAQRMNGPKGVFSDGTRLYVADSSNHRILIWTTLPSSSSQAADLVLGQANFATSTSGSGAQNLNGPTAIASDGTRLFVADTGNNRVLIWNTIPNGNQVAADLVLGQTGFGISAANSGGITSQTLSSPSGLGVGSGKLFVADRGNNRVLQWNSIPAANQIAASAVLGQPDFISALPNNTNGAQGTVSQSSLSTPQAIFVDGNRLYLGDSANSRILAQPLP